MTDDQKLRQFAEMLVQDHQGFLQKLDQFSKGQRGGKVIQSSVTDQGNAVRGGADRAAAKSSAGVSAAQHADGVIGRDQEVPPQLVQVMDQAHENMMNMTKEMLQKHEGQDFRMAFLGQQILAHTMMLAQLQAIESTGPQELQSLAQQAIGKTQNHLTKAKELANKNKDSNE